MFKNGLQIYTFCFKIQMLLYFKLLQLHEVKMKSIYD